MTEIAINCAHTIVMPIGELYANPMNPNDHPPEQIALFSTILRHQGWRRPVTVSRLSGFVVKGHGALLAAQSLGCESVPVDYQDYPDEATEHADMIADNQLARLSTMDTGKLSKLVVGIQTAQLDLKLTAFSDVQMSAILAPTSGAAGAPDAGAGGDKGYKHESQFGVIVMCRDEKHQEEIYNDLVGLGHECKVVVV